MKKPLLMLALLFHALLAIADEASIAFSPEPGIAARIEITQSSISSEISTGKDIAFEEFPLETETTTHLVVDDFNFDGKTDFSVWYLDEGMGRYSIHRVFVYSSESKAFVEKFPACGDEFLNLKVNKKRKRLISTYYRKNIPEICITGSISKK